jgi:hypothetical protein
MTWKDKLELGLKNDAPFRKDNLPPQEQHGPVIPAGPGRSPIVVDAVLEKDEKKEQEIADAEAEIPEENLGQPEDDGLKK